MRRPRAFTSSRMRAEPLPPPARKPLGYATMKEDSWPTLLTSPCGGVTGVQHSSSPPPAMSMQAGRTSAKSMPTPSQKHDGRTQDATCALSPRGAGSSPVRETRPAPEKFRHARVAAKWTGNDRAPARRIVFVAQQDAKDASPLASGVSDTHPVPQLERKRGSERSERTDAIYLGEECSSPAMSFSAVTVAARSAPAASCAISEGCLSAVSCSVKGSTAVPAAPALTSIDRRTAVSSPDRAALKEGSGAAWANGVYTGASPVKGDPVVLRGPRNSPWSSPSRALFDVRTSFPSPSSRSIENNIETKSNREFDVDRMYGNSDGNNNAKITEVTGFKPLEVWKAPEPGGTFSLGTPARPAGCGRRRRTLRVRVGG